MGVNNTTVHKRKAKVITNKHDLDEIFSLTKERASEKSLIMDYFGDFGDGPRFNPYDILEVPANTYGSKKKNKNKFTTTIGLYIFNKSFIEDFSDILGYINEPVTADKYDSINQTLSYALLEQKITLDQLKSFIMQSQILMSCTSAICPSHTMDLILIGNKSDKLRDQLIKQNKEALDNNDLTTMSSIESQLVDFAKEELKDSPSVDMFNSGARSKWGNNFKNMYLSKGIITQTDGSYSFIATSHMDGMKKEDFSKATDNSVSGPYARSRKTQLGGYLEKQITLATQHIKVIPGTDCGTKHTLEIELTNKNINDWMYSNVVTGDHLTEITMDNKDRFIGKKVKIRYSALCHRKDGICEACAGKLFTRIGIQNIGLGTMIMGSSQKNASMKVIHSSVTKLIHINPNNVF